MGERKVQAKYYPPDFDPSKLPRVKKKRENDDAVRFMLPMSVRCESCGEFMGTGLKFNARKSETGDNYLGIRIFRFTMRCTACPAKFSIRTDPKNSDYSCESGVRRNYEPWREKKLAEEEEKEERSRQDEDAMQALENKTTDAKKQMDDLDELDDIKSSNARRAAISVDDILARGRALEQGKEQEADRGLLAHARAAFNRKSMANQEGLLTTEVPLSSQKRPLDKTREVGLTTSLTGQNDVGFKVKKIIKKRKPVPGLPKETIPNLVGYESSSDSE